MKINEVPEIFSGIFYVYRVSGKALFSEIIRGEGNYFWMQGEKLHSLKIKKRSVTRRGKKLMLIFLFIACKQLAFSEKILLLKVI